MKNNLKKVSLLLLALIFTIVQLNGAPIKGSTADMEQTLKTLTSPQFAGRLPTTEGSKLCAEYLTDRFQKIGLEKFDKDSYYQAFTQDVYPLDKQVHQMLVTFEKGQTKSYTYGKDYVERVKSSDLSIKRPITFDIEKVNLSKIVILDSTKTLNQVSSQAAAVLIKTEAFTTGITPRDQLTPVFQITPDVYNELKNNKVKTIAIQSKHEKGTAKAANIIGKIKGKNSQTALVLSAHYDYIGTAGQTLFSGAIDNASGVTLLLDLAERLTIQSKTTPFQTDIYICAFDAEESAAAGSSTFIQSIQPKHENIYNINLDCLGVKGDDTLSIMGDKTLSKELTQELGKYADRHGIPYKAEEGFGSDHKIFLNNGISAVNLGQAAMDIIHTQNDTPDKIDYSYLSKISDMVLDFVLGNDGKAFKGTTPQKAPTNLIYSKLYKLANEEAPRLAYDEVKFVEINGFLCSFTGTGNNLQAEGIKKYYPNMQYPKSIGGFTFKEAMLFNDYYIRVEADTSEYKAKAGTVQKRDISADKLKNMIFLYEKEGITAALSVYPIQEGEKHPMTYFLNRSEMVNIEGAEYYLIHARNNDGYGEICKVVTVEGKSYFVAYTVLKDDKMLELSRDVFMGMAEEWGMEMVVRGLGI